MGSKVAAGALARKSWMELHRVLAFEEHKDVSRIHRFAYVHNQPQAELDIQRAQIYRKWMQRRTALEHLETHEGAIRTAHHKRMDELQAANEEKLVQWCALIEKLMPESATFLGSLDAWSDQHIPPTGTDDDQMAASLVRAFP